MSEQSDPEIRRLPTLQGAAVRLRHIEATDASSLRAIFGDPRVARFMGIPLLGGDADVQELLSDIQKGVDTNNLYQWGVTLSDSDTLVGTCTLAHIDWTNQRAEIGFALLPAVWRTGVMRAALPVVLDHAFTVLALHRIEADVDPRNERSLRLLEFLGFQREGSLRERHLIAGERQDTVLLGLLARDWRNTSPRAFSMISRSHFILFVEDQSASRRFYEAVLAAPPSLDVPGMTEFQFGGACVLGLMPITSIRTLLGTALFDQSASGAPRAELYLQVQDPESCHQRALENGAREISPLLPRSWGHEAAYSIDPDGHLLAFACPARPPAAERTGLVPG